MLVTVMELPTVRRSAPLTCSCQDAIIRASEGYSATTQHDAGGPGLAIARSLVPREVPPLLPGHSGVYDGITPFVCTTSTV